MCAGSRPDASQTHALGGPSALCTPRSQCLHLQFLLLTSSPHMRRTLSLSPASPSPVSACSQSPCLDVAPCIRRSYAAAGVHLSSHHAEDSSRRGTSTSRQVAPAQRASHASAQKHQTPLPVPLELRQLAPVHVALACPQLPRSAVRYQHRVSSPASLQLEFLTSRYGPFLYSHPRPAISWVGTPSGPSSWSSERDTQMQTASTCQV
mmetsp:Transcript_65512/g.116375  ORF Transcript_65512/g.116375 Transcript_65512/m.116375 type:complete len:207 (-) Transcript_65512:55-675(-)